MKVNGKERLIDRTKPGWERMYLTNEAKGHEIPVALGNTVATGGSNSTGATVVKPREDPCGKMSLLWNVSFWAD